MIVPGAFKIFLHSFEPQKESEGESEGEGQIKRINEIGKHKWVSLSPRLAHGNTDNTKSKTS